MNSAAELIVNPDVIWKTKLRSKIEDPDWKFQFDHCKARGLIGVGWHVDLPTGAALDDVCAIVEANKSEGWGRGSALTIRRFATEAKKGQFIWSRDLDGRYWLCRITGDYKYMNNKDSRRADVLQTRTVDWAPAPLNDLAVPGAVIKNFSTPAQSFSKINNMTARKLSVYWWEVLHGRPAPDLDMDYREVVVSALDPYDVEDLIFLWLQVQRGYLVLPRARQRDMPAYEWTVIHRDTRRRAITQVKTGGDPLNLDRLVAAKVNSEMETYAFATCEAFDGDRKSVTEIISVDDIVHFANANRDLLADRTRAMFELADR